MLINARQIHRKDIGAKIILLAIEDITEHKQAEDVLRESEKKLRATLDANPFPTAVVDLQDDKVFFWSKRAITLFGHDVSTADEWYRLAYPDLNYRREVIERWKPFLEIARKSGQPVNTGEYRVTCKDGSIRICELYATFLPDNLLVTFNDITERKQVEKAMQENEERFRLLFENMTSGSAVYTVINDGSNGSDYIIKSFNKTSLKIEGKMIEDVVGKSLSDLRPNIDNYGLIPVLKKVWKTGETAFFPTRIYQDEHFSNYYENYIFKIPSGEVVTIYNDVTENKLAEEELKRKESYNYALFENNPDQAIAVDLEGKIVAVNSAKRISGDRLPDIGDVMYRDYASNHEIDMYSELMACLGSGMLKVFPELKYRGKILSISIAPFSAGAVIISHDITERKRVDDELRSSTKDLRESQRIAHLGSWRLNMETNQVVWSEALYKMYGFDPALPPPPYTEHMKLFTPKSWERLSTALANTRETGIPYDLELETVRIDESKGWMWVWGEAEVDSEGKTVGLWGAAQDITERKRSEEALTKIEAKYSSYVENAPDGVFIADEKGQYIELNKAACLMTGFTEEELLQMSIPDVLSEESLEAGLAHFKALTETGVSKGELQYKHKDGSKRWWHVDAVKLSETRFLGFTKDITDRKQAEEEKQSLQERLQRAEKMEALGTLAGGVAHDLNNVLGIVVGYAEMLMDEMDESSPLRDDVMKIMEGGNRSASIVQDLLTLARRGVQTQKVVNLNATITDYQKTPEFEALHSLHRRVHIKTDLEMDLLNIMGSPVHLGKTIINLVTNAMEAMTDGGTLTISTSNKSLDKPIQGYDTVNEGDYVVLSITDTGEGISNNDIKRIFEPFYTKKIMGRSGTGLGLAVVWGTVKDHNGYINVQSEVGKGTTFTLYFPVTREEIAEIETAIPLSEYIGNDESILVIDDIKEQRELASKMLGKLNYKVKSVSSGEEAVKYLQTEKADLIILDMIMDPGMDGLDTYKAIVEIHPKQKAIIVSGFSETERVKEAKILGAGDYLRKPYVIERLGLAVRKELDRK